MKLSPYLAIAGLGLSQLAFAGQYQVTGLSTCYKVTGPYPEYRNCSSYGTYEALNCDQAFQQLKTQNNCCNSNEYTQFGGRSCVLVGGK